MKKEKAVEPENFLYFRAESKEEAIEYFRGYKVTKCRKIKNGIYKISWKP